MAITLVGTSAFESGAGPWAVPVPAGVQAGDVLIFSGVTRASGTTSISIPAGWTDVGTYTPSSNAGMVAWRIVGSSEPSTHQFNGGGSNFAATVVAYRGVDLVKLASAPFAVGDTTSSTTIPLSSFSVPSANAMLYASVMNSGGVGAGSTSPSMTQSVYSPRGTSAAVSTFDSIVQPPSTGNYTFTRGSSARTGWATMMVLEEAPPPFVNVDLPVLGLASGEAPAITGTGDATSGTLAAISGSAFAPNFSAVGGGDGLQPALTATGEAPAITTTTGSNAVLEAATASGAAPAPDGAGGALASITSATTGSAILEPFIADPGAGGAIANVPTIFATGDVVVFTATGGTSIVLVVSTGTAEVPALDAFATTFADLVATAAAVVAPSLASTGGGRGVLVATTATGSSPVPTVATMAIAALIVAMATAEIGGAAPSAGSLADLPSLAGDAGVGGPIFTPGRAVIPSYRSGMYLIRPRIYRADRENMRSLDITRFVTDASDNADIDRAGPKWQVQISASRQDALPVYGWIAPYQEITPEVGDVITSQMGLYRLEQPRTVLSGIGPPAAESTGWDVVTLLERAVLREAQTTPRGTNVMDEVKRAISDATSVVSGSNLIPNGHFASGLAGWTSTVTSPLQGAWSSVSGEMGTVHETAAVFIDTGAAGQVTGTAEIVLASGAALPIGVPAFVVEAWTRVTFSDHGRSLVVRWLNAAGQLLREDASPVYHDTAPDATTPVLTWHHHRFEVTPPDLAARATVALRVQVSGAARVPFFGSTWVTGFDMRVLNVPGLTRFALPDDPRTASAPISHPAGTSWLTRINDLLAAIGYHGIHATTDGRFTSRPYRDPATETPARTYTVGLDSRLTGDITIDRATGNIYNVVVVVKEDYQTKTSLEAYARNDDPDHPWSTVNIGERAPLQTIQVTDAVDGLALQARADYELARSSMQESLSLSVLPDGALTPYDVIELAGTDGPEGGRWAVESLARGLTANQPLVRVGARRTISPAWTEGQRSVDILIDTLIDVLQRTAAAKSLTDILEDLLS